MGKKIYLDLCDSLLLNIFSNEKFNNNNNLFSTTSNNEIDNENKLTIWNNYRNDPKQVLSLAYKSMSHDQKKFFQLVTRYDTGGEEEEEEEEAAAAAAAATFIEKKRQIYMLAGLPGTGKSFLQTSINLFFTLSGKEVMCLAPTNLIAYQQKGKTIHKVIYPLCKSLAIKHFKCDTEFIDKLVKFQYGDVCNMSLTELCNCITDICERNGNKFPQILSEDIIILIDEGTMVSSTLFALLYYCYPNATYIIMYGPNQLPPPVSVKGINVPSCEVCIRKEKENGNDSIIFCELISQMRFNSNNLIFIEFVQYFSDVLSGKIDENAFKKLDRVEYFFKNLKYGGSLEDYRNLKHDSKRILIVSTNKQRCLENDDRLRNEGEGPVYRIPTVKHPELPKDYDLPARVGIDDVLSIRKGVYCMIRINDLNKKLIKGQIIKIININTNKYNNNDIVSLDVEDIETQEVLTLFKVDIPTDFQCKKKSNKNYDDNNNDDADEDIYLTVTQFPITLSYSITAHSAQGKTLDCNIGIQLKQYRDNSNIINSYFVAITRVRDSRQIFMNFHPAGLLYFDMNIKSLEDVANMRRNLSNESGDDKLSFQNYVNSFMKRHFFGGMDLMSSGELRDINNVCKKICQQN